MISEEPRVSCQLALHLATKCFSPLLMPSEDVSYNETYNVFGSNISMVFTVGRFVVVTFTHTEGARLS